MFLEKLKSYLASAAVLLAPLLYLLLKRKSAEVADLKSKAQVTEAEQHVEKAQEKAASSAADYAAKRTEYDRLRGKQ